MIHPELNRDHLWKLAAGKGSADRLIISVTENDDCRGMPQALAQHPAEPARPRQMSLILFKAVQALRNHDDLRANQSQPFQE